VPSAELAVPIVPVPPDEAGAAGALDAGAPPAAWLEDVEVLVPLLQAASNARAVAAAVVAANLIRRDRGVRLISFLFHSSYELSCWGTRIRYALGSVGAV
jgi:hypothetical protein